MSFDYIKTFLFSFTSQEIGKDVRTDMLKGLMNTDIAYFKQEKEGDIISKILNESSTIENFISGTLPNLITVPLTLILTLCALLILNVKLTLACFVACSFNSIWNRFCIETYKDKSDSSTEFIRKYNIRSARRYKGNRSYKNIF